ncbi:MAG TPA: ABC transporter ATP-binding protein [Polyangiaceae bacterium]|nr:ABC transporter ATP-binding protein [Polyangiaceae bacterium]
MSAPAIRCEALVKRYGEKVAVAGVDLEIPRGECFGLLGPNGAGKTTTVELLEGLTPKDSGRIELFGIPWGTGRDRELRARFGVQLQHTELADKLTVEEVLTLFRSFYPKGKRPEELIALLNLEEERRRQFCQLSGGQKQRVALGCALAGAPDLLFLDEPTTGLDPRARKGLWGVVENFRNAGGTVLITTHYMEEAAALCDRIAIMDAGKIIALGTPRALVDALGLVQFLEFEVQSALDEAALRKLEVVQSLERRGERYRVRVARSLSALARVFDELERQGVIPIGLSAHQATLDDVFLSLTGRGLENHTEAA